MPYKVKQDTLPTYDELIALGYTDYQTRNTLHQPTGNPKTEWWRAPEPGFTFINENGQEQDFWSGRIVSLNPTPYRYCETGGSADTYYRSHCGSFTRHRRGECSHGDAA